VESEQEVLRAALIDQLLQANILPETDASSATAVQETCVQTVLTAYENARMDGLCHDGAWECALDAMRSLNVEHLVAALQKEKQHA
jgi:hypothetical protein